jgi:hypothetical protein
MASLRNLTFLLAAVSFSWAKEKAPKKGTEAACDCSGEVTKLQDKIKALEKELSAKQGGKCSNVPYASFEIFERSLSTVSDFVSDGLESTKAQIPELSIGELSDTAWKTANQSFIAAQEMITKAAPVVSETAALAQAKAGEASVVASDIYATHLKPHVGEYVTVTADAYGTHLSPHVKTAQKMYDELVQPKITDASKVFQSSLGSAVEKGMAMTKDINMADGLGAALSTVKANSKEPLDVFWAKVSFLYEPKELKFMGKTFPFPYGYVDMAGFALQAFFVGFIAMYLSWKLVLKTIVWKILLKFFGRKLLVGTTTAMTKLSYKTTKLALKIVWFVIALVFKAFFFALRLVIACSMGFAIVTGADKGAQAGLQKSAKDFGITLEMRLAASLFLGMLFYCCCCCGKRKKVDKSKTGKSTATNGHTNGHAANGKGETNGKAKQVAKAQPKKKK